MIFKLKNQGENPAFKAKNLIKLFYNFQVLFVDPYKQNLIHNRLAPIGKKA